MMEGFGWCGFFDGVVADGGGVWGVVCGGGEVELEFGIMESGDDDDDDWWWVMWCCYWYS